MTAPARHEHLLSSILAWVLGALSIQQHSPIRPLFDLYSKDVRGSTVLIQCKLTGRFYMVSVMDAEIKPEKQEVKTAPRWGRG